MIDIGKDLQNAYNEGYEAGLKAAMECEHDCKNCWKLELLKPHWIPCSKELPRESENVLIQFVWSNEHYDIGHLYYDNVGRLRWYGWLGGYDLDDVVAWMPLPEPYKR